MDRATVVPTHLHLASSTLWNRNIIESDVSLTMKSDCLHHRGGNWMGDSSQLIDELVLAPRRFMRKRRSSRCYLLCTGSLTNQKRSRHWVPSCFGIASWPRVREPDKRGKVSIGPVWGQWGISSPPRICQSGVGGEKIERCKKDEDSRADQQRLVFPSNDGFSIIAHE